MNTVLRKYASGLLGIAGLMACGVAQSLQLPDLYVQNIQFVNGVWNGPCNTVRVDIRNSQSVGVSQKFEVTLTGNMIESNLTPLVRSQTGIGPGATLPITFTQTYWAPIMIGYVDRDSDVAETNERNNGKSLFSPSTSKDCPKISISDASASEGDYVRFTVSLDKPFPGYVTTFYRTTNGTATGGSSCSGLAIPDFRSASRGFVRFSPNQTSQTISIQSCDDSGSKAGRYETSESFSVSLYGTSNATYGDETGTGTILVPVVRR
ncbi:MAG: hypothetical protein E4H19_09470 [Chromatiales bacterium]|jgi:hypothetical protein|nr:MAG: hypothetical protein E4H19_09470 [Chromatiales bacterium]